MTQMMKVEWNPKPKQYQSALLDHDAAWTLYYELEDQGFPVGIESMSDWECQQYLESESQAAKTPK
jgi:hypothetical protein